MSLSAMPSFMIHMKKPILLAVLLLCLCTCCGRQGTENASPDKTDQQADANNAALHRIIDFYEWYRDQPSIQNCLVLNSCNEIYDSTRFYAVDFKATEDYLEKLKRSGYVSDKYLAFWREYFKTCDGNFRKYPTSDGVPDGFDYDFITNSQDFEEELKTVEKAVIAGVLDAGGSKTITVKFTTGSTLNVTMSMINGQWYIDKIA